MDVRTDTKMPPFGVAETLLSPWTGHEVFLFWLLTHSDNFPSGSRFWRTVVLRECLPSADAALDFIALSTPQ